MKFYSNLGNKLKKLGEIKYPEKFIEDKSYSYLDSNGQKIKLKYEIERERRLFKEFIRNMSNYEQLEEGRRKNYFSRLRGYKDIFEEKKIAEERKKRFQNIMEFKRRKELMAENRMLINYSELQSNIDNYYLKDEKKRNNYRTTKDAFYRNKDNIYKNKLQKLNHRTFLSLNSSINSDSINNNGKKMNFIETNNLDLMNNIIRKRMHINKSTSSLLGFKKQMSLFQLKLKKNETLKDINPQFYSLKETSNTNFISNESNSFNLNLSSNLNNKLNTSNNNNIKNIKSSSMSKFNFNQNNIQIYGMKVELRKSWKTKNPLTLEKIKDKNNDSFNNNEIYKMHPERMSNDISSSVSNTNEINKRFLEKHKRPMKLKKFNSIKSKKVINYLMNNFSNSLNETNKEKKIV